MVWERVDVPVGTHAPTGQTAAYLSGEPDGLLVDPADRTPALDEAVAACDIGHVAVTHHHPDHVGAPEGDMRAYLASLRRLSARDPAALCPGHGPTRRT